MKDKEKKSPLSYAFEILSRRDYSRQRLIQKLLAKKYTEEETNAALARLEELGLMDDGKTAQSKFRFLYENGKNSVKEIKYKLLRQGFLKEDIEEAAAKFTEENGDERELSAALKVLRSKYKKDKDPLKMRGYLFRHGFSSNICYDAARAFLEEE